MKYARRRPYGTDLNDAEWKLVRPLLPPPQTRGRPRETNPREVLNALSYLLRSGCPWRPLPHDFPDWELAYYYFSAWKESGDWQRIHDVLRAKVREAAGKDREPTAAILDSQSVKTVKKGELVAMTPARR